ncbi:MAG: hypothetical protein AB7O52_20080 [Planctomycetota bacterium]
MRSPAFLVFVSLLALLAVGDVHAQPFDFEGLQVDVDFGNLYKVDNEPWPSTVDAGLNFNVSFAMAAGTPSFQGATGTQYVADQSQLANLTVTSPNDLYNNHNSDFVQYASYPLTLNSQAAFGDAFTQTGSWATFFVFSAGGSTYATQIFYHDIVDYSAQSESWTVGPGWDGATPFVFVNVVRRFIEFNGGPEAGGRLRGSEAWGLDVIEATAPRNESSLEILLPSAGQIPGFVVKRLFPLSVHSTEIDAPLGLGAVVEPNMSLDGNWVIFSYFHDVKEALTPPERGSLPLRGADIYTINLAPLLANPAVDPATLPFHRITSTAWATNQQDLADKNSKAMNPDLAQYVFPDDFKYGRIFMHAIETKLGGAKKLVFASNLRRLGNSNDAMDTGHANHNLNLFEGRFNFSNGNLKEVQQVHYYTTTSAMSPAAMRDGFSFAYQSTTEEARSWEVQITKSNYQWSPGVGYGSNGQTVYHLQTLAPTTAGDWLVTCFYYNINNNGFGTLVANPAASLGVNFNAYVPGDYTFGSYFGEQPRQVGMFNILHSMDASDEPGYHGKITAPRAGATNQLFASYSPETSNDIVTDTDGNRSYYDSYIVSLPDVNYHLNSGVKWSKTDLQAVLNDGVKWKSQVWGVPVLSHLQRFGSDPESSPFVNAIDAVPYYHSNPSAIHGMPMSVVGTSALSNTDVRTREARFSAVGLGYDLHGLSVDQRIHIQNNFAGLSKVLKDASGLPDIFQDVRREDILGVAIHLTSNKADFHYPMEYATAGGDPNSTTPAQQELTRLLGVYDVRTGPDDSFMAAIPSNAPFEMQLIDAEYGLKLVDQRSWKSLRSLEVRNNCDGCHGHLAGQGIDFSTSHAAGATYVPDDMTVATRYIEYDAFCDPKVGLAVSSAPALTMPEYFDDVLPGLQAHCGTCHTGSGSAAANAFSLDDPIVAYDRFRQRRYYSNDGALSSPLFWAARGKRTDNRSNPTDPNSPWKYSSVHDSLNLCDGTSVENANFVYTLGLWLDHMMPRRRSQSQGLVYGPKFDRFHPSVNFDLPLINNNPNNKDLTKLLVGYWDDTDFSPSGSLKVLVNGTLKWSQTVSSNGSVVIDISTWNLKRADVIEAVAEDGVHNRQYYQKAFRDLVPGYQEAEPEPIPQEEYPL